MLHRKNPPYKNLSLTCYSRCFTLPLWHALAMAVTATDRTKPFTCRSSALLSQFPSPGLSLIILYSKCHPFKALGGRIPAKNV